MNEQSFDLSPMKDEEARYSYRNSQQISSQTGLIGYLRADMGTNGNEFWSTWNDFRKDLKTDAFKNEFDNVINYFREKGQFLSDRQTLSNFCDDTQKTLKFGERYGAGRDYGVRVNTQDYAYLMRLNPHRGEYNLYCYCYRKDWLDSHLVKARRGIRFINSHYKEQFRIPDGDHIRITYPDGSQTERTCRYIDDTHMEADYNLYHIGQFAEIMERNGHKYEPIFGRSYVLEKPETYDGVDVMFLTGGWNDGHFPTVEACRQLVRFAAKGGGVFLGAFRGGAVRTGGFAPFPEIARTINL